MIFGFTMMGICSAGITLTLILQVCVCVCACVCVCVFGRERESEGGERKYMGYESLHHLNLSSSLSFTFNSLHQHIDLLLHPLSVFL